MSVFRKSRKGISLVEEICSVALLAIGVIAAVGAINLSRVSVTADTLEEAAAARAQKLEDSLVACLSKQPSVPLDMGARIKGAKYVGSGKSKFDPTNGEEQYVIEPAPSGDSGYLVFCRVYYDGGKRYVELSGFASSDGDSYAATASGIPLKPIPIPPPPPSHAKGLPFVLYGSQYGSHTAFKGGDDSAVFEDGDNFSDYPVVFGPNVQDSTGKQTRSFSAPSMFFLGGTRASGDEANELKNNSSIYAFDAAEVTMKSNFIYIASRVITFKQDTGDKNATPKLYITPLDTSKPAYIYFAQDCDVIRGTSLDENISSPNNKVMWHAKQGLYSFTGRQDLWEKSGGLTPVSDADKTKVLDNYYVDYIVSTYKNQNLMAGWNCAPTVLPYNGRADWTFKGKFSKGKGKPSSQTGKDVYMYVNSTDGWGSDAQTYKANRIGLQYVAKDVTLTLPKDKQVTFEAGTFGLNMQSGDGDVSQFKEAMALKKSPGDTKGKFIVNCSSLILYHGLNVTDSDGKLLYHLDAGEYTAKSGGFDLFDKPATMAALGT